MYKYSETGTEKIKSWINNFLPKNNIPTIPPETPPLISKFLKPVGNPEDNIWHMTGFNDNARNNLADQFISNKVSNPNYPKNLLNPQQVDIGGLLTGKVDDLPLALVLDEFWNPQKEKFNPKNLTTQQLRQFFDFGDVQTFNPTNKNSLYINMHGGNLPSTFSSSYKLTEDPWNYITNINKQTIGDYKKAINRSAQFGLNDIFKQVNPANIHNYYSEACDPEGNCTSAELKHLFPNLTNTVKLPDYEQAVTMLRPKQWGKISPDLYKAKADYLNDKRIGSSIPKIKPLQQYNFTPIYTNQPSYLQKILKRKPEVINAFQPLEKYFFDR